MSYSEEEIRALAPNERVARQLEKFWKPARWRGLAVRGRVCWGEVRSGGMRWFRTAVQLNQTPQFHCNCPSRLHPCVHGLALLRLSGTHPQDFQAQPALPDWVQTLLAAPPPAEPQPTPRPLSPHRGEELRPGVEQLQHWLSDLLQQGLASLPELPPTFWTEQAARLVDAQLGALARRLRNWESLLQSDEAWPRKILQELGDMYLLTRAFLQRENLPPALLNTVLSLLGKPLRREELPLDKTIQDQWLVWGQVEQLLERSLFMRQTWMLGRRSGRFGQILEFAWGAQGYPQHWEPGGWVKGKGVFYPEAFPLRLLLIEAEDIPPRALPPAGYPDFEALGNAYATALAENPWLKEFPARLRAVRPYLEGTRFLLADERQTCIPLQLPPETAWRLLALSAGHPLELLGLWNGHTFLPFGAVLEGTYCLLHRPPAPERPRDFRI